MSLHGGDIYKIYRETNIKVIDYSANINSLGVPKNLKKHIKNNINSLVNYPDPNYIDLRNSISKNIKIPMENIIVGNGATEIIFLFIKTLKPKKTLIISPTFAEYERALKENGSEIHYFELSMDEKRFFIDFENLKTELNNFYDLVVFCNPNNPTGSFTKPEEFEDIFRSFPNTKFLIDEAFIDFVENGENFSFKKFRNSNLFIVRAFTKFFAIPGLRLGYGISFDKEILNKIYEIKEPWSLNFFAGSCGTVLLEDKKYIKKTIKTLKREKLRMLKSLNKIKNLKVFESHGNFFLIKLKKITADELYENLLKYGFLIRKCENFKFLDKTFIRIAIKDNKNNKKILKTIKKLIDY